MSYTAKELQSFVNNANHCLYKVTIMETKENDTKIVCGLLRLIDVENNVICLYQHGKSYVTEKDIFSISYVLTDWIIYCVDTISLSYVLCGKFGEEYDFIKCMSTEYVRVA